MRWWWDYEKSLEFLKFVIYVDKDLKFDIDVEGICQKANTKLNALARIANYIELPKRRIFMNAFFKSQFNNYPAFWMFHSRTLDNKINILPELCLRIICNDKLSNFEELLHKDNSVSIYHTCICYWNVQNYQWYVSRNKEWSFQTTPMII